MAGFFDFSNTSDPNAMLPLMSALAGLMQNTGPSQYPRSIFQGLGAGLQGYVQGKQAAQDSQYKQNQINAQNMQMRQQFDFENRVRDAHHDPLLNWEDYKAGKWSDTPATAAATLQSQPSTGAPVTPDATAASAPVQAPTPPQPLDPKKFFGDFVAPHEGSKLVTDINGAPVKYGINQKYWPAEDVSGMTEDRAGGIFSQAYFKPDLPAPMAAAYGDTAFLAGSHAANAMLQQSGGDPSKFLDIRRQYLNALPANDKIKAVWNKRTDDLGKYVQGLSQPNPATDTSMQVAGPGAPAPQQQAAAPNPYAAIPEGTTYEQGQQMLMEQLKAPREFTPTERSQFLSTHPDANPHSTWGINPITNQPVEMLKSDLKSPGAIQQDVDEARRKQGMNPNDDALLNSGLSGNEFLAKLPAQDRVLVKMVANYQLPPGSAFSIGRPNLQRLLALAGQYDPTFDGSQFKNRMQLKGSFMSGPDAKNIQSMNTVVGHAARMDAAIDALHNSNYPQWNWLANTAARGGGDTRFQAAEKQFVEDRDAVANELMRTFRGTGASETEVKEWRNTISAADSPAALHSAVKEAIQLMRSRLEAVTDTYNRGMGTNLSADYFLTPHSRKMLGQLEGDNQAAAPAPVPKSVMKPKRIKYDLHGHPINP